MRVACVTACVLGLFVGCDNDDAVVIDTTAENFCDVIADVACHNLYQCCTEGEIENYLQVSEPRTELECREDVLRRCSRVAVTLQDSITAGRVTFDAARMNECLNAVIAPIDTCSSVVTEYPWEMACEESAWVGTVALGGSCVFSHDCQGAPDNYCSPTQKCAAKPTAGQPCGAGCATPYYCTTSNICQPRQGPGAACTSNAQCIEDLYCDFTALPTPVCAVKQPGGSACTSDLGCVSGTCVPGQCVGSTQECYRDADCYGRCGGTGSICTQSSQCSTGTCSVGGNPCTSNTSCTATNDMCIFPITCVPGDCVGDPVCTSQTLTVNYCAATTQIPLI